MRIEEHRHGAVTVLAPSGPLVQDDARAVRDRALAIAQRALGRLVLDAAAVAYADSAGLEALLDISEALAESGQALRLAAANETLREVLELTEIAGLFEHYEDVNSAVRSFL